MIFYSEPDEGTIMIWIDEMIEELKKYNFENANDNIDGIDTIFLYFLDANLEEYNEIIEIVKQGNYKIFGWEINYE